MNTDRTLSALERKMLDRFEAEGHKDSEFLARLGFVTDEGFSYEKEKCAEGAVSQFDKMLSSIYGTEMQPKKQNKLYLGRMPKEPSVTFMRHFVEIVGLAKAYHLMIRFEDDGRIYLTSTWWNYRDKNDLQYSITSLVLDAFGEEIDPL